jgi:sulfotransferase family protein
VVEESTPQPAVATKDPSENFDCRAILRDLLSLLEKQLFFIGGAIGSGTTWLQLLLDQHPKISCRGEGHFVTFLAGGLHHIIERYNNYLVTKNRIIYRDIGGYPLFEDVEFNALHATAMLLLMNKQRGGKPVLAIGEKTPDNVRTFDGLRIAFPTAMFVHMLRDPRDAAVSGWHLGQRTDPAELASTFGDKPSYFRRFAELWANETLQGLEFGARYPRQYIQVRYADLSEQSAAALQPVLRFLGVDASAEMAQSCMAGADFQKLSGGRPRGMEDPSSHLRRGVVGDWVNHLDPDTNRYFLSKAGSLMRQIGIDLGT